jgi:hypothetical protein
LTKSNGRAAQPKKGAEGNARPLTVNEVFTLCGGSTVVVGQVLIRARGRKDVSKSVVELLLEGEETLTAADRKRILGGMDEDEATRFVRRVVKKIADHQAEQAQPSA